MLRSWLDGIPLDLAATLLPGRSRARFGLLTHLILHARAQRQHAGEDGTASKAVRISKDRLSALITNLRGTVEGLRWEPAGTEWADYADNTSYSDAATAAKARLVESLLRDAGGEVVWDLGANTGRYSAIAAGLGRRVVSWDIDPAAVERHHRALKASGESRITPLLIDLADPSPAQGWALQERASLVERSNADVLLGLALVHHLAIGRNVPLPMIATFFGELAGDLVLEWVPRGDVMVDKLLSGRKDIFEGYHEDGFRGAFEGAGWEVCARQPVEDSSRVLYRFRRR
jgi:ribosomal protein L11 methylase PrmA